MNILWLGAALFAFIMGAITIAGYFFFLRPAPAEARPAGTPAPTLTPDAGDGSALDGVVGVFQSIGEKFPGSKSDENPYRRMLMLAGFRTPSAVPVYYGVKCGFAILLAAIGAILALYLKGELSAAFIPAICGAGLGFLLPDRFLKSRADSRAQRLRRGLPAALDLMVLGVEAGVSLDQVIVDTSRGLRQSYADLSSEFVKLYLELKAGVSRSQAFRNLADRNKEPELRKLATVLTDSDRFGSSLAPALRTHAQYLRIRFRHQAQERARKVSVKLIFPVFFLIFPSVLLVTLVPACLMMYTQVKALLS